MPKPHEDYVAAVLDSVFPTLLFAQEYPVPRASRTIDFLLHVPEPTPVLGHLSEDLARRIVILEHMSGWPDLAELMLAFGRAALFRAAWARDEDAVRTAAAARGCTLCPALVVVAAHLPDLDASPWFSRLHHPVSGLWHTPPGSLLPTWLVNADALPDEAGWRFFRLLKTPRSPEEGSALLAELIEDPTFPIVAKDQLIEDIMNEIIPTAPAEKKTAYQIATERGIEKGIEVGMEKGIEVGMEKGIEKGIEVGIEKGVERGRGALLQIAAAAASPDEYAELASIADIDELGRRVLRLVVKR